MRKTGVLGVGINDADYEIVKFSEPDAQGKRKQVFRCPYYFRWHGMLSRCFNKGNSNYKQYEKTTVCEDWLTFSNFKRWMEGCDWEGKVLDKDLRGYSTLYSPETCIWIPQSLNAFIEDVAESKDYPIPGIYLRNRYEVQLNFKGERTIERVETIEEAVDTYINFKLNTALKHYNNYYKLIEKLYSRRKQGWLTYIEENRSKFPVLSHEIQSRNIPKIGDRFQTKKGYWYTVKEYRNTEEVIIEFDTGGVMSTRNRQIKTGAIRCKSGQEIKEGNKISKRVDKYFKTNKHNLLTGIFPCGENLYGVSYKTTILCCKTLEEAVVVRKEKVIDEAVKNIIKNNQAHREQIERRYNYWLEKFNLLQ